MVARIHTVAFHGIETQSVDVEVQLSNGLPSFTIVGLPDKAVAESKERVRSALHALGISMPPKRVTVNLAPADLAKEGSHFDLPIALGVMAAMGLIDPHDAMQVLVLGELSLDGRIRPVSGILPAAVHAASQGLSFLCPAPCAQEAMWAGELEVLAPTHLLEVINHYKGTQVLSPAHLIPPEHKASTAKPRVDMAEIKGHETAKRALEIAAAGGHHLLMMGPPGSGKSMLAKALPGIMPPLTPQEALETSMIHSMAGLLPEEGVVTQRPYRDPHHSASLPALVGGGHKVKPGEISLAHHGVLFLDELPEFSRATLESLRQPIENGDVVISRANHHVRFPAEFQLIAAMNPCRCGYLSDPARACTRAPRCAQDYQAKISGPMMDRFDMCIEVSGIEYFAFQEKVETQSADILKRVQAARNLQEARAQDIQADDRATGTFTTNARANGTFLETIAPLSEEAKTLLERMFKQQNFSARSYYRILRVARTIADLDGGGPEIGKLHMAEALSYRRLDPST